MGGELGEGRINGRESGEGRINERETGREKYENLSLHFFSKLKKSF